MTMRHVELKTRAGSYKPEERTIEFVLATETPVVAYDYDIGRFMETLSMDPAHVRMDRVKGGAPVLDTHSRYELSNQVGVIRDAWMEGSAMVGRLQISSREDLAWLRQDLADGIYTSGSAGFKVYKYQETTLPGAAMRSFTAVDWELMEYSLVPVPADPNAKARAEVDLDKPEFLTLRSAQNDQESNMDEATKAALAAQEQARAEQTKAVAAASAEAASAERTRAASIMDISTRAGFDSAWAEKFVKDGSDVEKVRAAAFDELAKKQQETSVSTHIQVTENGNLRAAVSDALYARMTNTVGNLKGEARDWAGARMLEMGDAIAESQGIKRQGRDSTAMVQRALHTTSDFPTLFTQVVDRVLREQLAGQRRWFDGLVVNSETVDFRASNTVTVSGFPDLIPLNEHGEIEGGTFKMSSQSLRLGTYARMIGVTRQILINDDLGVLSRVVAGISQAITRLENKAVSTAYLANPTMTETGQALFSASHGNLLTGAGSALSLTSLSSAAQALRKQKNQGAELLDLQGKFLVVGSALADVAAQLLAPINATTTSAVNIYSGKYEVKVDTRIDDLPTYGATAWFLFAAPTDADVLHLLKLSGQSGPMVDTKDGWNVLGMETRVVHDMGAGVVDYRGAVRANGAV
jgi:hypothetical protein